MWKKLILQCLYTNLVEYSDNYSDTSGNLWQFKRDKLNVDDVNANLDDSNALHLSVRPVLLVISLQKEITA